MKTFYNKNSNVIEIKGNINTFEIYNDFLDVLNQYMLNGLSTRKEDRIPPVISLEKVTWIDAHAIPILISIGTLLKEYYSQTAEIILPYNPRVISYLKVSKFLDYVGDFESYIFYNDRNLMGLDLTYKKTLNPEYIVDRLAPYNNYYDLPDLRQRDVKFHTSDVLETTSVPRLTHNLFPKNCREADKSETDRYIFRHLKDIYTSLAEIMCNASLYSGSYSYFCVQKLSNQSNSPGVYLSISDNGRGFDKSLLLRPQLRVNLRYMLDKELKDIITSDSKLSLNLTDYFAIFEALYTSASNERYNLWKLILTVIKSSGIIRIHNNKTQVLFNLNNMCSNCNNSNNNTIISRQANVLKCMNCMVRNYSSDKRLSQLRLFNSNLQGVHIEIDFPVNEV